MRYFYYDEATSVVTVLPEESTDYGIKIGSTESLPRRWHMLVHAMLSKKGIVPVGMTIIEYDEMPEPPVQSPNT